LFTLFDGGNLQAALKVVRIPSKADVPVTSMSRKDAIFSQVHAETSLMCVLTFDHGRVGVNGVVANYPFICAIP